MPRSSDSRYPKCSMPLSVRAASAFLSIHVPLRIGFRGLWRCALSCSQWRTTDCCSYWIVPEVDVRHSTWRALRCRRRGAFGSSLAEGRLGWLGCGGRRAESRGANKLACVDERALLAARHGTAAQLAPQIEERERPCESTQDPKIRPRAEGAHETASDQRAQGCRRAVDQQERAACCDHLRGLELVVDVRDRQRIERERRTGEQGGERQKNEPLQRAEYLDYGRHDGGHKAHARNT